MTLDELTRPLTVDEVRAAIYDALERQGVQTATWKPGAVVRTIIAGASIVISAASRLQAALARGGFLDLAEADWLTLIARHVYGVERHRGSFASGQVTLTNTGGGIYSGDAGDLVFSCSVGDAAGKTYRNTAPYSLAAMSTLDVPVEAVELGSASTAGAGDIDTLETALIGVTVTNALALVGTDEEGDEALRQRCRDKLGSLSPNGPRDAYAFVARTTRNADGETIGVTRTRTVADGAGGLTVYVASAGGTVAGPDVALIQAAVNELAEPLAITATVASASPVSVAVTYELWVRESIGLTRGQIEDAVEDALDVLFAGTPIGGDIVTGAPTGRVYKQAIEGAITGAVGAQYLVDLAVTVPTGDVDLNADEVPARGTINVTDVHLVASGGA